MSISGHDYEYWTNDLPLGDCVGEYFERIELAGRGIVLMHDSSEDLAARGRNRALALTQALVPRLKSLRFKFVRLDAVPQVSSATMVSSHVLLRVGDGRYVSAPTDVPGPISAASPSIGPGWLLGIVELGHGLVAIRASDGSFFTADEGAGVVRSGALVLGDGGIFTRVRQSDGRFAFRTVNGLHVSPGRSTATLELSGNATPCLGEFVEFDLDRYSDLRAS